MKVINAIWKTWLRKKVDFYGRDEIYLSVDCIYFKKWIFCTKFTTLLLILREKHILSWTQVSYLSSWWSVSFVFNHYLLPGFLIAPKLIQSPDPEMKFLSCAPLSPSTKQLILFLLISHFLIITQLP